MMNRLSDKLAIFASCSMLFLGTDNWILQVISVLSIVSATSLCQYVGKSRISLITQIIYLVTCMYNPYFLFFIPVIIYDIFSDKRYYLAVVYAVILGYNANNLRIEQLAFITVITIISVLLNIKTNKLENVELTLIETRDNSAEINMLLTEKNQHLRENQDYEIHLATLSERNRIAREIHDNVGHLLSRSILQTGALQVVSTDKMQKESLANLNDTLNNAMTTIRKSVHDLHDDSIDLKTSLIDATKPLKENGLKTKIDLDFTENIPNNIKLCFISIVKESVSNILKHSNANTVAINFYEHPGFFQLTIVDDGVCSETIGDSGIGLSNMRDRIEGMGGLIQINSSKKGFRIFITLSKKG